MRYYTISGSSSESIQKCPRFSYYDQILNLTLSTPKPSLLRGSLVHIVLESYYKDKLSNLFDFESSVTKALNIGEVFAINKEIPQEIQDKWFPVLKSYFEYYKDENWKILKVEKPFSRIMWVEEDKPCKDHESKIDPNCENCKEGFTLAFQGKIDLEVEVPEFTNLGSIIVDHKSVERNDPINQRESQFLGYTWARDSRIMIVNRIGSQKDESLRFNRLFIQYPSNDIHDEWRLSVVHWFKEFLRYKDEGFFPMNYSSCNKYGGCPFLRICDTEKDTREWVISSQYREKDEFDLFGEK